jgi:hypothetical protein
MTDAMVLDGKDIAIPPIVGSEDFLKVADAAIAEPFTSKFGALFLDELDQPGPEFTYLVDGFLSDGDKSIVGGASQSGKSFLAIEIAMCIAYNIAFFGCAVRPGLVIYQAGEGARGIKKRLRAWRKHHKAEFSRDTPFVLLRSPIDIYKPDGDTDALIAEIKTLCTMFDVPLRLIVIDTLNTAAGGAEENSSRDMGMVMANIAKLNAATGAAVMLVHHMNAGGTKLRGSTAIYANVDQVILVSRDPVTKVRTARLDKQKDDEAGGQFQFELSSIDLGKYPNGKPITSCVCLPVGEKEAMRRGEEVKGFWLKDGEVLFMRAFFEAETKYGQPIPGGLTVPSDVRSVVAYDDVKRAYATLSPSDSLPTENMTETDIETAKQQHREKLKKRLQRAREFLMGSKVVGYEKGKIWFTGKPLRAFPKTIPKPAEETTTSPDVGEIPF